MASWLVTTGIAVASFTVTNIDDVFILIAFFADPTYRVNQVVIGQFLGIGALILISLILALVAMSFSLTFVRLLGLIPLFLGLKGVWELRTSDQTYDKFSVPQPSARKLLTVASVTLANGGDNIGVYVPLFSTRTSPQLIGTTLIFLLMTGLWCLAGHYLVNHPSVGKPLRSYGRVALPIVLTTIGVLILAGV